MRTNDTDEEYMRRMFLTGVVSESMVRLGEDGSRRMIEEMSKKAGHGYYDDDEDEDDGETFFQRHKGILIPALVGAAAFWAGADGERHGRKDRGYLSNAWNNISWRLGKLLGIGSGPVTNQMTSTIYNPDDDKKK